VQHSRLTLLSLRERKAEFSPAPIKQLSTNTKCNLLNVDFCCAARVCAHIRRLYNHVTVFSRFQTASRPSDGVHGSYQLARWVSYRNALVLSCLANFRVVGHRRDAHDYADRYVER